MGGGRGIQEEGPGGKKGRSGDTLTHESMKCYMLDNMFI